MIIKTVLSFSKSFVSPYLEDLRLVFSYLTTMDPTERENRENQLNFLNKEGSVMGRMRTGRRESDGVRIL